MVAALDATSLSRAGCRAPEKDQSLQEARAMRLARTRSVVLQALRECERALGRPPRAQEFLRWRSRHSPDAPSRTTVYRVFPEGWSSALEALSRLGSTG
jgi:hypothetical protein